MESHLLDWLVPFITNNRSIPDSEHTLVAALDDFQFKIWEMMTVEKMWNPTIPQDKKFSTVIKKLPAPVQANHREVPLC